MGSEMCIRDSFWRSAFLSRAGPVASDGWQLSQTCRGASSAACGGDAGGGGAPHLTWMRAVDRTAGGHVFMVPPAGRRGCCRCGAPRARAAVGARAGECVQFLAERVRFHAFQRVANGWSTRHDRACRRSSSAARFTFVLTAGATDRNKIAGTSFSRQNEEEETP